MIPLTHKIFFSVTSSEATLKLFGTDCRKICHCEEAEPTHPRVVSLALRAIHLLAIP